MTTKVQKSTKDQNSDARPRPKPKREPKIDRGPHGMSVVAAGRLIGLGRNKSYEAAKAGIIPTIRVGALMIVPRGPWLKRIGADDAA
jgi:hypothetical protein